MNARKPDVTDYRAYPDRTDTARGAAMTRPRLDREHWPEGAVVGEPAPIAPTAALGNTPPEWALVEAEYLRRRVRDMDAEDAEMLLAWALFDAGRGITRHGE